MRRATTIRALLIAGAAALAALPAAGQGGDGPPEAGGGAAAADPGAEMTAALDAAVAKGFSYLAASQQEDGSFGGGRYGKHVGITALACLAFMSDGRLPGRGPYGEVIEKGLDFILENQAETGLLAADTSHGPMYGHGFATLFLGEVYGMTRGGSDTARAERVHDALVRAVRLIVQTQNSEGGWRYNPVPYDADVSVTICEIMALRAARNAGIEVPKETIDRAVEYVRRCQNADGGFRYQLQGGGSAWPRSAAGLASLYYAGIYEDEALDAGLEYLMRNAMPGSPRRSRAHFFYGQYYSAQAMYLAGGEYWERWWPPVREEMIDRQQEDGSWSDRHAGGSYGTAMALIVLQMPKRYLPIFQK